MVPKIKSFKFLSNIFKDLPTDIIYYISKFSGKYILQSEPVVNIYKTKNRKDKYYTRHLVLKTRLRSYTI